MSRGRLMAGAVIAAAAVVLSLWGWRAWYPAEESTIRGRLDGLRDEINSGAVEGLGTVTRAASIGSYFADDVVVDFGQGTAPITGRDTLMGMAARLQPRTAVFKLELNDVNVDLAAGNTVANVTLTALFVRRSVSTGEQSMDAREFELTMIKAVGVWRIRRVAGVDALIK